MSQLDRAFIRAYTSEQTGSTADASAQTSESVMNPSQPSQQKTSSSVRTMSRKPTLSELQHWKNQGIRIDMPGSPLVGSYEESNTDESAAPDEFLLAAQNTAAVAEALDRLMIRAGRKHTPVNPVSAQSPKPVKAELPSPTIEIDTWEPQPEPAPAAAEEDPQDESMDSDEPSFTFVAGSPKIELPTTPQPTAAQETTSPAYRQRRLAHPKWETETLAWPEETDMVLDLCHDQWVDLASSISGTIKSLALVSLGDGTGCSTLTMCLAKLLAAAGRRVLIIDQGSGSESLSVRLGLTEVVASEEKVETLYEAMIQAADQPIAILPAGYRHLADLSAHQLQQFTGDFDVVLWDGGDRPEVWQRLALVQGVLVVRDARGTHDQELSQILPKLQERKINVIGIAENFWR
ncbi:hypothetical protein Pan97_10070 [Bremerella volcania]|uniref:CobQ/CobB/MinD/ParA nucleotide binding domain protein n=1 Tax=Bremerella volcania TaxID=2527984 RepID=A0A518C466_9BACT|nr:CpsD/CapB family tyrosine-protein kinase [Bremerella volcania]QDU74007.1 hypothetical protein Pan97_10070 [Bremerella volcania]